MSYVELAFFELTKTHNCYAQFEGVLNDESDFNKVKVRTNTLDTDGISYIYANDISLLGFTWEDVVNKSVELETTEPLKYLRVERNKLLDETDWWVLPDRTATDEQLAYRQALRDITDTYSSLDDVVWPAKPE